MDRKKQFESEKENITGDLSHIVEQIDSSELCGIDRLYGEADALSLKNAKKHRRVLMELSAVGTLLTLFFLLYDEAELYGLIIACGAMILSLFLIRYIADRSQCHRKYLEYRVLAESLRVQYYLFLTGVKVRVSELLPWSIKQGLPWITEIMSEQPIPQSNETHPIADCWINDQKEYHKTKLVSAVKKNRRDNRIAATTIIITISAYIAAMAFEILVSQNLTDGIDVNLFRAVLKVVVGTMSAATLFTGNYYGKMSLPNIIDDHKRMIALYESVEEKFRAEGESSETILDLARECLNENATWYAYQNKNKPDLVI